jgi:hypothetical protein
VSRLHLGLRVLALAAVIAPAVALAYGNVSGGQPSPQRTVPSSAFRPVATFHPEVTLAPESAGRPESSIPAIFVEPGDVTASRSPQPRATPALPAAGPLVVVIPKPKPRPVSRPVSGPSSGGGGVPSVADAKAYALARIGSTQFSCLNKLWTRESNWNPYDVNSSSGAYGIPQALPGDKMATAGADWKTNPVTQVKWGLSYISSRYGTACNAWAHSQQYGWY